MGMSEAALRTSIDELVRLEPAFARAFRRVGYPEPRTSDPGYVAIREWILAGEFQ